MTATALKKFIKGVDYDEVKNVLTVSFQTSTYRYHGVPEEVGKAITSEFESAMVEWVFNARVEGKYKSERVTA